MTKKNLTPQQTAACNEYSQALDERNKCHRREEQKKEAAARAAAEADTRARLKAYDERRTVFLQATNDFMDALKIGMTSVEVDAVEKQAFHNPAGWGRTVNTTVTASGRTEQWVYRFSKYYGAHDLYLYLYNGELTAIQK